MTFQKASFPELELIYELIFKPFDLRLTNIQPEAESQKYTAHRFQLSGKLIIFRVSKITPTKTGQFVSLWKRNAQGSTAPFHLNDEFDYLIIATKTSTHFGAFIFPKKVLLEHRILSHETTDGKRGIRVYPSWDETTNQQAQKTQLWQTRYFLNLSDENQINLDQAKDLLTTSNDRGDGAFKKIER
ncbi:MepB family protein [Kaistella sp. 97-N-M2]|uniref:MepB family protein n=1 Tax=Kaistella sp. 97-N-M2 TaxID=2908645 RepID=UPI001F45EE08|nr:MepB family protein [Kaistella sp. 97-N-M2]UJF29537.1 MepB family protein [Kaistella sp. 97-N-M2]